MAVLNARRQRQRSPCWGSSSKILIVPYSHSSARAVSATEKALGRAGRQGGLLLRRDPLREPARHRVVRNAAAMRVAVATPKFIMDDEPRRSAARRRSSPSRGSRSRPRSSVNYENMMVASARMLAARVKLPFEEFEKVVVS